MAKISEYLAVFNCCYYSSLLCSIFALEVLTLTREICNPDGNYSGKAC